MKGTLGQRIVLLLSVIAPLLFLSMYLPIWNGKEISLANAGIFPPLLFAFQCLSLILAVLQLVFVKLRHSDSCLMNLVFGFFLSGHLYLRASTVFSLY